MGHGSAQGISMKLFMEMNTWDSEKEMKIKCVYSETALMTAGAWIWDSLVPNLHGPIDKTMI